MASACALDWFVTPALDLGPDTREQDVPSSLTAELAWRTQGLARAEGWRTCLDCPAQIKASMTGALVVATAANLKRSCRVAAPGLERIGREWR